MEWGVWQYLCKAEIAVHAISSVSGHGTLTASFGTNDYGCATISFVHVNVNVAIIDSNINFEDLLGLR